MSLPNLKVNDAIVNIEQHRVWVVELVFQNGIHDPWQYRIREVKYHGFTPEGYMIPGKQNVKGAAEIDMAIKDNTLKVLTNGHEQAKAIFELSKLLYF